MMWELERSYLLRLEELFMEIQKLCLVLKQKKKNRYHLMLYLKLFLKNIFDYLNNYIV